MRGLALSPAGRFHLTEEEAAPALTAAAAGRLEKAFAKGPGEGLLFLATAALTWELGATLSFGRELARLYLGTLCAQPDLESVRDAPALPPPRAELEALVLGAPPMAGAEYLTAERLEDVWRELESAVTAELRAHRGDVATWLAERNPLWSQVGRVSFHLAENKADPESPFAFLVTYAPRLTRQGRVQYTPLSRALSAAGGKEALLSLLTPLQRAARKSALLRELVDSGAIFHPLAWSPAQAHRLLQEAPLLHDSGIVLRLPDWWRSARPPRPEVVIKLGESAAAGLGLDALLDFSAELSLGGETLSRGDVEELLAGEGGLVSFRGKWIEVDKEKLAQALAHWQEVEKTAADGLTFLQGMRLLAGARIGDGAGEPAAAAEITRVLPGEWLRQALDELRRAPAPLGDVLGSRLHGTLRPYQERGVVWMDTLLRLGLGGCLADDMGLGKTVQVIAVLLLLKQRKAEYPSLLVLPASLLSNWTAELERFAPSLRTVVAHPSALGAADLAALAEASFEDYDVVLTTYGTLMRQPWLQDRSFTLCVLDEAQAIKNPSAKQTRAAKAVKARGRLALTGTPVENRLGDLWSIFDFAAPGLLGSPKAFGDFTKRLAKAGAGYAPLRELVRPYILRRLKTDRSVIADLPEKTEMTAYCTLSKRQAFLYERAVKELAKRIQTSSGIERKGLVLSTLMRLKQICNHPAQALGDGEFAPDESGKFARLAQLCEEVASRQEKVLVFTQFQQMTAPLSAFLAGVFGRGGVVLDGTTPVARRRGLVEAFQGEDGPPFFVLSVKAGGTGLNLTAASHVIHFDRWWNPAVEDQATDRAFRIGQKRNVLVHKFVCQGTVEERIDALLLSKKSLSRELLEGGGGEVLLTELPDEELLRLVALDVSSALSDQ